MGKYETNIIPKDYVNLFFFKKLNDYFIIPQPPEQPAQVWDVAFPFRGIKTL